jgi:hypothetical protein
MSGSQLHIRVGNHWLFVSLQWHGQMRTVVVALVQRWLFLFNEHDNLAAQIWILKSNLTKLSKGIPMKKLILGLALDVQVMCMRTWLLWWHYVYKLGGVLSTAMVLMMGSVINAVSVMLLIRAGCAFY